MLPTLYVGEGRTHNVDITHCMYIYMGERRTQTLTYACTKLTLQDESIQFVRQDVEMYDS